MAKKIYEVHAVDQKGFILYSCYRIAKSKARAIEFAKLYAPSTKGKWYADLVSSGNDSPPYDAATATGMYDAW